MPKRKRNEELYDSTDWCKIIRRVNKDVIISRIMSLWPKKKSYWVWKKVPVLELRTILEEYCKTRSEEKIRKKILKPLRKAIIQEDAQNAKKAKTKVVDDDKKIEKCITKEREMIWPIPIVIPPTIKNILFSKLLEKSKESKESKLLILTKKQIHSWCINAIDAIDSITSKKQYQHIRCKILNVDDIKDSKHIGYVSILTLEPFEYKCQCSFGEHKYRIEMCQRITLEIIYLNTWATTIVLSPKLCKSAAINLLFI